MNLGLSDMREKERFSLKQTLHSVLSATHMHTWQKATLVSSIPKSPGPFSIKTFTEYLPHRKGTGEGDSREGSQAEIESDL